MGDAVVRQETEPARHTARLSRGEVEELFITVNGRPDLSPREIHEQALAPVRESGGQLLSERVFGPAGDADLPEEEPRWPVTRITTDENHAAVQLHAVSGAPVHRADCAGSRGAAWFADGAARYCHVGGVVPDGVSSPRQRQATAVFEALPDALQACGVGFGDVARTWFYLDDILAWYDEFNQVRDEFFARHRVYDGLVPASTGIGMANAAGAALAAEAVAIRPTDGHAEVRPVASPRQNSPTEYGSSFSRAVEADLPDHRRLYVSGTASIDREGRTVREGDFEGQLETTLSVVEKILEARRMDWNDVTRAVAYVRHTDDMPAALDEMDRYPMPVVTVPAVVCRDNLLFELEVDAISAAD